MKALKIAKGKGRALQVAIVPAGEMFKVFVQKSNYNLGRDCIAWFVVNSTMKGVTLSDAEKVFKARAAA